DLDQRVQDHRPALVEVDLVGVGARVLAVVRVPAVHLEGAHARRPGGRLEVAALADLRVLGEGEFSHGYVIPQYTRATGGTPSASSSRGYMCTGRWSMRVFPASSSQHSGCFCQFSSSRSG